MYPFYHELVLHKKTLDSKKKKEKKKAGRIIIPNIKIRSYEAITMFLAQKQTFRPM